MMMVTEILLSPLVHEFRSKSLLEFRIKKIFFSLLLPPIVIDKMLTFSTEKKTKISNIKEIDNRHYNPLRCRHKLEHMHDAYVKLYVYYTHVNL